MLEGIRGLLKIAPELALFFSLAVGHAVGRIKFGRFSLGSVAGSLLVALIVGQLGVDLPDVVKSIAFALFIYAVGFKSGPEFFGSLNRSTLRLVMVAVTICVTGLLLTIGISRVFGLSKGFAAGMGAGALTESATMGTAADAIHRMDVSADEKSHMMSDLAVAFGVTYVFGTIGVILFTRSIAPRIMGIDPKKLAKELETQLAGGEPVTRPGHISPYAPVVVRAFLVEKGRGAAKTISGVTTEMGNIRMERILRGTEIIERPDQETVLNADDIVVVAGPRSEVVSGAQLIGEEVDSKDALAFAMKRLEVVLTNKQFHRITLERVREIVGPASRHGIYLLSLKRQGLPMPILSNTEIRRGDVVEITGRAEEVDRAAEVLGSADPPTDKSDLVFHLIGMVVGTLIGMVSVSVAGIPITLGAGGGVLLAGLIFGWARARYPIFGGLPGAAQWILAEFGLTAFAAVVGLAAGQKAVVAIQQHGPALLVAGAVVTLVPQLVGLIVGWKFLKIHPVILLGALAGGQTVAAALSAINDEAESVTPVLGFTVTYAVANVLLAVWGSLIVALT